MYMLFILLFQENERLERLVLAWNGLGVEGARAIGKALVENTTLKYLDLSCTRLTEGGAALLATGLERNQGLSSLIVSSTFSIFCQFSSKPMYIFLQT